MAETPAQILLVEDDAAHARLICRAFEQHPLPMLLTIAGTIREAQDHLARSPYDLVLCDLLLPDGTGRELLPANDMALQIPLVLITSHGDEQTAVEMMKAGAMDYVAKSSATLAAMPHIAERVLREWEHLAERKRAEQELAEYREQLQDLVQERTAEPSQANRQLQRDIAERKRTEAQLALFRRFVEESGEGMGWTDLDGRVQYVNSTLCRMLGESKPQDAYGRPVLAYYSPETQRRIQEEIFPTVLNEGSWTGEMEIHSRDGRVMPTTNSVFVLRDDRGDPFCFANVVTDLSERKRTERRLQSRSEELERMNRALTDAKAAAEAANRAKSEFLANMSHELRTPLHGILSYAAFGIKETEAADQGQLREYFQKAQRSGNVLLRLLSNLLDLAKLESGRMDFDFVKMDLAALVHLAQEEFDSLAADREITIHGPDPEPGVWVVADRDKLIQVLRNLLSNAIKFSPDGGTVDVTIESEGQSARVSVHNSGVGIPEDELATVFDKFVQSSKTRTGAGGTGLGLSISREIIAAHRGRIWAENRPEGGAGFVFEIPLDFRNEPPVEEVEPRRQDAGSTGSLPIVTQDNGQTPMVTPQNP